MKAFEKSNDETIPKICVQACNNTGIKGDVSSFHAGAETHIYAHEKNKHGEVLKPYLLGLADIYNMHSSDEMVNIESFLIILMVKWAAACCDSFFEYPLPLPPGTFSTII